MLNFRFFSKSRLVKRKKVEIEPDDIFLDTIAQENEETMEISSQRIEPLLSEKIFMILLFLFFSILLLFLFRVFYFQVVDYNAYINKSENNKFIYNELKSQRGIIYDRNSEQLVENSQSFDLYFHLLDYREEESLKSIKEVADILNKSFSDLVYEIENCAEESIMIEKDLDLEKVIALKTKIDNLEGFEIVQGKKREYVDGAIFSHILGFVDRETLEGKAGIEEYYDQILEENTGTIKIERDALGNILEQEVVEEPESGKNLILNIDANLQRKATQVLEDVLEENNSTSGALLVMDANTGGILSMVSLPSFDNNIFSTSLSNEEYSEILSDPNISFYNRAISGSYPIGSTIKPMLAIAGLEEGIITADDEIFCQGGIQLSDGTFKSDWDIHGWTNLNKAIAESCDVYFYILGGGYGDKEGLGIDRIIKYLKIFGFGEETGIDLPKENSGFVPTPEWKKEETGYWWYPGDTYNISIGQGYFEATPLQLTIAIASIANKGKILKPKLVKGIADNQGNIIEKFEPEIIKEDLASYQSLQEVRNAMQQTVLSENGTARSLQWLSFTSGAKTGTVQTGKEDVYHNLITAFAPFEDPEIVVTVITENVPDQMGITNQVAREILSYYFEDKNN